MAGQFPDELNLLLLLSQSPAGLTLVDIKAEVSEEPTLYGDWEQFLKCMIFEEHNKETS